jgi:hypothetical protein
MSLECYADGHLVRLRLVMAWLAALVLAVAGCGGAEPATDVAAEPSPEAPPPAVQEEAPPPAVEEEPPASEDLLVCGPATETRDAESDVVHWSGSAVEPVATSRFIDIRRVVVSRTHTSFCADIETVRPPRKPSAFFILVREWGAPDHGWLVKAEVVLLDDLIGARLGYPSAETGPDPRIKYGVVGNHLRVRIPKRVFPD